MTPTQIKQAESEARDDAKKLALLLLLLFRQKKGFQGKQITYDAATAKFSIDGRTVSIVSIRMYLTRIEDRLGKRLLKITSDLEKGEITFTAWQREFERTVSSMHVLAGALILGSIEAAAGHRFVQERIDEQLTFADKFATDIRKGGLSAAKLRARAKSYARAAHITFSNLELSIRIALGRDMEAKRVLRALEHCRNSAATPGCLELARQGWMPIEEMVPIAQATCGVWCRCYIVYR